RALLEEEGGKADIDAHLQELAFPILEDRREEMTGGGISGGGNAPCTVLAELGLVRKQARDEHASDRENGEHHKNKRQAVAPPDTHHIPPRGRSRVKPASR